MGLVKMKHKQVVILIERLGKLNQNTFGEGLQHGFAKTACMKLVESVTKRRMDTKETMNRINYAILWDVVQVWQVHGDCQTLEKSGF